MYTLTHTHSRRINIFLFGNSVSEGSSSTIVEDTEKNPETPDTRMIQTFRDLFRDEGFAQKIETKIKTLPNGTQGPLLDALYGVIANNHTLDSIHDSTHERLGALLTQIQPKQEIKTA